MWIYGWKLLTAQGLFYKIILCSNPLVASLVVIDTLVVEICFKFVTWPDKTTWLNKNEPLKVSHHPASFSDPRHCGGGDILFSASHVISQDQMIMWLYEKKPLKVSHHPVKFGVHRNCGSWDIVFLICHVISQDHIIKGSCEFIDGNHLS